MKTLKAGVDYGTCRLTVKELIDKQDLAYREHMFDERFLLESIGDNGKISRSIAMSEYDIHIQFEYAPALDLMKYHIRQAWLCLCYAIRHWYSTLKGDEQ